MLHVSNERKYFTPKPNVLKIIVGVGAQAREYHNVEFFTLIKMLETAIKMCAQGPFRYSQFQGYSHQTRPFTHEEWDAVEVLGLNLQAYSCDVNRAASATLWRHSTPQSAQAPLQAALEVLTFCQQYGSHHQDFDQLLSQVIEKHEWALHKLGIAITNDIPPGQQTPDEQDVVVMASSPGASASLEAVKPGHPERAGACPSVNETAAIAEQALAPSVGNGANNPELESTPHKKVRNIKSTRMSALLPGQIVEIRRQREQEEVRDEDIARTLGVPKALVKGVISQLKVSAPTSPGTGELDGTDRASGSAPGPASVSRKVAPDFKSLEEITAAGSKVKDLYEEYSNKYGAQGYGRARFYAFYKNHKESKPTAA